MTPGVNCYDFDAPCLQGRVLGCHPYGLRTRGGTRLQHHVGSSCCTLGHGITDPRYEEVLLSGVEATNIHPLQELILWDKATIVVTLNALREMRCVAIGCGLGVKDRIIPNWGMLFQPSGDG